MLLKKLQIDFQKMNSAVDSLVGVVRERMDISEENEYKIRLVSKELLTNVLSYSDADDILISASLERGVLTIIIEDNGRGFEHADLMERDVTKQDFLMDDCGRGVFLVRMMAQEVEYNDKGNKVSVKLDLN